VSSKTGAPPPAAIVPNISKKNKHKQSSSRAKRRTDKAREKAAELSGKLEVKVQQREGRKVRGRFILDAAANFWSFARC
jgi:hypothetical protein